MSIVDTARLIEIVSSPAETFALDERPAPGVPELTRRKLSWWFGKVTSPDRTNVVIVTTLDPVAGADGSRTFFYEPRDCVIRFDGVTFHSYTALGLYTLAYDESDPLLVQGLAMAARTLSSSVGLTPPIPAA
jgi:hypothetical protein